MRYKKVYLHPLGCPKALVDSEKILSNLESYGFKVAKSWREADIVIVYTCGFLQDALKEAGELISEYSKGKNVVAVGCAVQRSPELLQNYINTKNNISFVAHTHIHLLPQILQNPQKETVYRKEIEKFEEFKGIQRVLLGEEASYPFVYVKISEGCNRECSFCIIPKIRGKYISRPIESIIDEVKYLVNNYNKKEIVLISQDTINYGIDLYGKRKLIELVEEISNIPGIEWIRLMYLYPDPYLKEIARYMRGNPKLVRYFDIPFQHINDRILRLMKRWGSKKEYENLLNDIKDILGGKVSVRATFIVGFPTEEWEEYTELEEFIETQKFDKLALFEYSDEPGTESFSIYPKLEREEIERRYTYLMEIQNSILREVQNRWVGEVLDIIVEEVSKDRIYGRSWREAPEIDGKISAKSDGRKILVGDIVKVKIERYRGYDGYGVVV